ncbi:MAG: hypothetical protein V1904_09540 [Bacteroidota bacterium]
MKTKLFIAAILILAGTLTLSAQHKSDSLFKSKYANNIGIGAGFTTGFGISYRYLPCRDGFQVNFTPYLQDYGKDALISIGLTYLHKIVATRATNLYLYFGNHYRYINLNNNYSGNNEPIEKWNTGIGIGFEFHTQKRVVWNIMGGYAQYDNFRMLLFTIETALYYRF